ncbi:hypothetical protein [Dactylosporangium sp. NPDC000521]|uniref:hypothetical protein n=1 Tax=Dactylosporangium sp. NPDC000521 TaxID=3363975 RepID=UPI0036C10B3E
MPGTDLILAMSRRLFAACEQLAATDHALAAAVASEAPMPRGDTDVEDARLAEVEWDSGRARQGGLHRQR